jgi:RNA polymerase sigma-70 factor (ECF subfamily)
LGDASIAYDVVQEVFLRALRSWDNFRHGAHEKTWLLSIARNYMHDYMRKQKKRERFMFQYEPPFISDETLAVETAMVLEQALMSLKKTYRQVFMLRHIENLSIAETAQILGWSQGKVRTTDYRAIASLRCLLGANAEEVNP